MFKTFLTKILILLFADDLILIADSAYELQLNFYPADRRHQPNGGLLLGQRRRRWADIKRALNQ